MNQLEESIIDLLKAHARGLSTHGIGRRMAGVGRKQLQHSLIALQRRGVVQLIGGTVWSARGIPREAPYRGDGRAPTFEDCSADAAQRLPPRSRWLEFRRLCLYYSQCLRVEQAAKVMAYGDNEGRTWFQLSAPFEWDRFNRGEVVQVRPYGNTDGFVDWLTTQKSPPAVFLGCPIDLYISRKARDGNRVRIVSPVFVQSVELVLTSGQLKIQALDSPAINQGWLEGRFKNWVERQAFLKLCGFASETDADDTSIRSTGARPVDLVGMTATLSTFQQKHWIEPWANGSFQPPSSLQPRQKSGIYNRLVIVGQDGLKYTANLYKELRHLAFKATDDQLDATSLISLFPHQEKGASSTVPPKNTETPIACVDPLNDDQMRACRVAVGSPLSVITGPPGTGKSRVVLNTLINMAIREGSALFASRNHQAIEAVVPRLEAITEPYQIILRTSHAERQQAADNLQRCMHAALFRPRPPHALEDYLEVRNRQQQDAAGLAESSRRFEEAISRHVDLEKAETEAGLAVGPVAAFASQMPQCSALPARDSLERLAGLYRTEASGLARRLWWALAKRMMRRRAETAIGVFRTVFASKPSPLRPDLMKLDDGQLAEALSFAAALARAAEAEQSASEERASVAAYPSVDEEAERWSSQLRSLVNSTVASIKAFAGCVGLGLKGESRQRLAEVFAGLMNQIGGSKASRALKDNFGLLVKQLPLWATTNLSVGRTVPLLPSAFDLLIIDEASQCDIASVIPLLYRAKRVMVVGDPMQLPHVSRVSKGIDAGLRAKFQLTDSQFERFSYRSNSFFSLAATSKALSVDDQIVLCNHHRSHPHIAEYSNQSFYSKTLNVLTDTDKIRFPTRHGKRQAGIVWTNVPSDAQAASKGAVSPSQIVAIVDELSRLASEGFDGTVGVVSPFRIQRDRIHDAVMEVFKSKLPPKWKFHVDTADGFQGDERDVILFSLVGGPGMPEGSLWFYRENPNRFNVAVSRARAVLHVFGDREWAQMCGADRGLRHIEKLAEAADGPNTSEPVRKDLIGPVWEPAFANELARAGLPFVQQYPVCGRFLDFAMIRPGLKLDVEIDGECHRQFDGRRRLEDLDRDRILIASGWKVRRFWVYQLKANMKECVEKVRRLWDTP